MIDHVKKIHQQVRNHPIAQHIHRHLTKTIVGGFTLIEILIVTSVIGVVATAGTNGYVNTQERARNVTRKANIGGIASSIANFYASKRSFPSTLSQLSPDYILTIPKDPKGIDTCRLASTAGGSFGYKTYINGGPNGDKKGFMIFSQVERGGAGLPYKDIYILTGTNPCSANWYQVANSVCTSKPGWTENNPGWDVALLTPGQKNLVDLISPLKAWAATGGTGANSKPRTNTKTNGNTNNQDPDGDGTKNSLEPNTPARTNPCVPSTWANNCDLDTDEDGKFNSVEGQSTDTDGDGTPDYQESSTIDQDLDTVSNETDPNNTNPCIPSTINQNCYTDTDGDGSRDFIEGLSDDTDDDGIPNYQESAINDTDDDGIVDQYDSDIPSCGGVQATIWVSSQGIIIGGPDNGKIYAGTRLDDIDEHNNVVSQIGTYVGVIMAGNGGDIIVGTSGKDVIWGGNGTDTICGGGGQDFLYGGNGVDKIDGGDGNDTLVGGLAGDIIYGGNGNDRMNGDGILVNINGGANDWMDGGQGTDTSYGEVGTDKCILFEIHMRNNGSAGINACGTSYTYTNPGRSGGITFPTNDTPVTCLVVSASLIDGDGDSYINKGTGSASNDFNADDNDGNTCSPNSLAYACGSKSTFTGGTCFDNDADGKFNNVVHGDPTWDPQDQNPCVPNNSTIGCTAMSDNDKDGFRTNVVLGHPEYDPDDSNRCIPKVFWLGCNQDTDNDGDTDFTEGEGVNSDAFFRYSDELAHLLYSGQYSTIINNNGLVQIDYDNKYDWQESILVDTDGDGYNDEIDPMDNGVNGNCIPSNFGSGCQFDLDGDGPKDREEYTESNADDTPNFPGGDNFPNWIESILANGLSILGINSPTGSAGDPDGDLVPNQIDPKNDDPCIPNIYPESPTCSPLISEEELGETTSGSNYPIEGIDCSMFTTLDLLPHGSRAFYVLIY